MNLEKINLLEKFEKLTAGDYAIGLIAKMNNYEFKIVKFKGDLLLRATVAFPITKRSEIITKRWIT